MGERGKYVVIEGIDGSGKTELVGRLVPPLLHRGHSVARFREPTDAFLRARAAELVRSDPLGAALCFTVDRMMLRPELERSLANGDVVLQDRSFYSTLAYQGSSVSEESARELDRIQRAIAIVPDLVLYLDLPVRTALSRVSNRGARDAFEEETYLDRVQRQFERLFEPPRWVRIDAKGSAEATLERAVAALIASGL